MAATGERARTSVHADQVDDKDERLVGFDDASGSGGPVTECRRNGHPPPAALSHALDTLFPAGNHIPRAEGEAEGLIAIP